MCKVSICIPTYKQILYLRWTLESVLAQTYKDYEVIITDDSPDNSVANLLAEYNFLGKLKYFKNSVALGSPENWNKAVSLADGEYIKILHHDDWFSSPESLGKYVKALENSNHLNFAFSSSMVLFGDGRNWIHCPNDNQLSLLEASSIFLFQSNWIGAPSSTIYRNNFESTLQYDPTLKWLVDIDFYINYLTTTGQTFKFIKEPLVTTYGANQRVTDECKDNIKVELFENFYLYHKISRGKYKERFRGHGPKNKVLFLQLLNICSSFNVRRVKEIRRVGYEKRIPFLVIIFIIISYFSSRAGKAYLILMKRILHE